MFLSQILIDDLKFAISLISFHFTWVTVVFAPKVSCTYSLPNSEPNCMQCFTY